MRYIITVALLALVIPVFGQDSSDIVKFSNPSAISAPRGYSHVADVDLGHCRMILISGQVPLDSAGNLIGKDDIEKQTEQVFNNIKAILGSMGGTMNDLVKIGVYMRDARQLLSFRNVRSHFVNNQHPPTSTLVEVSRLYRDDILIEIEAMAIIPKVKEK